MATGEGLKVCNSRRKQLPATGEAAAEGAWPPGRHGGPDITKWARTVVKAYIVKQSGRAL